MKRIAFALSAILLALALGVAALLVLDLSLHAKFDAQAGLNRAGYRGPLVGAKRARRVVVLGESTAFGYGVTWREAWPAYLQQQLAPSDVVNLAYNNEGAHSYASTLKSFAYLQPDVVIFYSGYNDLSVNTRAFRQDSLVFRLTGYFPISPIIFAEKAMALRYGGNLDAAYRNEPTTFRPNVVTRLTATALEASVAVANAVSAQHPSALPDPTAGICGPIWGRYCAEMGMAIRIALAQHARVITVTQPLMGRSHEIQQEKFHDFLDAEFRDDPVSTVNLGRGAINLTDQALCFDGMHLTPLGNQRIAAALLPAVREALR